MKRLFLGILFCAAGLSAVAQNRAIVDIDADNGHSIQVGDSTATALVGNVIFHHNGAILTCDSAVRYSSEYIECFNNVIINRDSTYIYGDRVDFNGLTNIAQVFAPIIKTVDGDMTMYSYDMEFNTLTKIGRYTRGGVITQKDNRMESREAIYHADERDIFFVNDVVMRNEEYIIQTDSMGYNLDSELTTFYKPAKIWNKDGDFLSADRGSYDRSTDTYNFTKNSYILTDDQEVFADSITYLKTAGLAYMFGNIQIHDHVQLAFLFGDYGIYWFDSQQGIVTDRPSVIAYEEGENRDSVYMRSDTIFVHTIPSGLDFTEELAAQLRMPRRSELDSIRRGLQDSTLIVRPDSLMPDSLGTWEYLYGEGADSTLLQHGMRGEALPDSLGGPPLPDSLGGVMEHLPDSLAGDGPPVFADSLGGAELSPPADSLSASGPPRPVQAIRENDTSYPLITDPPADSLLSGGTETPVAETPKDKRERRRQERLERRREKMREYAIEQGLIDTLSVIDTLPVDSLPAVDTVAVDTLPQDSLQRIIRAYRNVKVFRQDVQAVCDSLIGYSIDSTAHMYIEPILWNEKSQVTADEMHMYSRDGELYRADFEGDPLVAQWVLDELYNQIVGDRMEAYFANNEIREMHVLGNSKAYYYQQEESRPEEIGGFWDTTSKDMKVEFDSLKISRIIWMGNPVYTMYPMDKIEEGQSQRFDNFEWLPERRPQSSAEVCDRDLRPSQREATRSIAYPQFRLTETMDRKKKRLTEEGLWRDRNDILSVDPSYFRNRAF